MRNSISCKMLFAFRAKKTIFKTKSITYIYIKRIYIYICIHNIIIWVHGLTIVIYSHRIMRLRLYIKSKMYLNDLSACGGDVYVYIFILLGIELKDSSALEVSFPDPSEIRPLITGLNDGLIDIIH